MATRWRWRRFKLKYMKLSSVFDEFSPIFRLFLEFYANTLAL